MSGQKKEKILSLTRSFAANSSQGILLLLKNEHKLIRQNAMIDRSDSDKTVLNSSISDCEENSDSEAHSDDSVETVPDQKQPDNKNVQSQGGYKPLLLAPRAKRKENVVEGETPEPVQKKSRVEAPTLEGNMGPAF